MRILVLCTALVGSIWVSPTTALDTTEPGPYDRVAPGKPAASDTVVYTNDLLKKILQGQDERSATRLTFRDTNAETAHRAADPVTSGGRGARDDTKVYTNEDLKKRFGIVEQAQAAAPPVTEGSAGIEAFEPDPLAWLEQRQLAQREHRMALAGAQQALVAARERVTNLEKQVLAARNPFSARPQLSEEEKTARSAGGETAAERYTRTQKIVEEARQAVRAAEAEVARLRSNRP